MSFLVERGLPLELAAAIVQRAGPECIATLCSLCRAELAFMHDTLRFSLPKHWYHVAHLERCGVGEIREPHHEQQILGVGPADLTSGTSAEGIEGAVVGASPQQHVSTNDGAAVPPSPSTDIPRYRGEDEIRVKVRDYRGESLAHLANVQLLSITLADPAPESHITTRSSCLLYTSDAADD